MTTRAQVERSLRQTQADIICGCPDTGHRDTCWKLANLCPTCTRILQRGEKCTECSP